jgi:hypothetical protein
MKGQFSIIFGTVVLLTVACAAGAFALALIPAHSAAENELPLIEPLFNALVFSFGSGCGAVIGLVGGYFGSRSGRS